MKSEEKSKIDELYKEVTSAIRFAEELEDVKSPSTAEVFMRVSIAESHIGTELALAGKWDSFEWEIAWRGAVRAAMKAGDKKRAENIVAGLKAQPELDSKFGVKETFGRMKMVYGGSIKS